jgi:hypothetical protein
METEKRKRSLDINKLSPQDAERISDAIGLEVRKICDDAVAKANELLNIYGMKALMQIAVVGIDENSEQEAPKRKRQRSKKAANL